MDSLLLRLVPQVLARYFESDPRPLAEPRANPLQAAAIFADISGFTALTENLTRKGASGIEELTGILNRQFGALIDTIDQHGGDIFKFAGDALLALWPAGEGGLSEVSRRAAQCALAAQQSFGEMAAAGNLALRIRIAVGAGPITIMITGGVNDRWEAVAAGAVLGQLGTAVHLALPGEVVLSGEVAEFLGDSVSGRHGEGGMTVLEAVRETTATPEPGRRPPPRGDAAALRYFASPTLVSYLRQGRGDWIGELRRVTVIFVHFPGLTHETPLERAQLATLILQRVVARYEGSLNKLSVDDKGAAMVAVLGLPTMSHEDDPARGVLAALEIREQLNNLGVHHAIGVTTGPAFCGVVGNSLRCEYTVIGDVVNLAARLMQKGANDILCCGRTREAAAGHADFEPLPPVALKGKEGLIPVFRPAVPAGGAAGRHGDGTPLAGRKTEQAWLAGALRGLAEKGVGGCVILEGPMGIGKSRLAHDTAMLARARGLRVLRSESTSVDSSTPYFAWRAVFAEVLDFNPAAGKSGRDALAARLATSLAAPLATPLAFGTGAEWAERLALINAVFPGALPETATTAKLAGPALVAQTHEFLLRLLPAEPAVLILEDAQWMDSASWTLARELCKRHGPLLLVLSARPGDESTAEDIRAFRNVSGAQTLTLGPLDSEASLHVVAARLGVTSVPERIARTILDKAEGNPLFCQELARALQEAGIIIVNQGVCEVTEGAAGSGGFDIPETVQAAIISRIDRLPASQQIALKAASAIGRIFRVSLLRDVYPIAAEREQVGELLGALATKELLASDPTADESSYEFCNTVFHNVAYNMMLLSQKRHMHRAIAERMESSGGDDLSASHTSLAWHWGKVVETGEADPETILKAANHYQRAGEQALRRFANREGLLLLSEALRLRLLLPPGVDRNKGELAIQCQMGGALITTRGFAAPETEAAFSRAWELCLEMGSTPEEFWVLAGLWKFFVGAARFDRARELAQELITLAEVGHNPSFLVVAHRAFGETALWTGDLNTAREHLEQVGILYRPEYHETTALRTGQDPAVAALGFLSWTLWLLGFPDQSAQAGREQIALAARLAHPNSIATATIQQATHNQLRRETARSRELVESLLELTRREGFQPWLAGAMIMHGWMLVGDGEHARGISQMCEFLGRWKAIRMDSFLPYYIFLLADAYVKAGQPEKAMTAIEEAIARSEATGEAWWRPELYRLKGEILQAIPAHSREEADACFHHAARIARELGARSLEQRALSSLAEGRRGYGIATLEHDVARGPGDKDG